MLDRIRAVTYVLKDRGRIAGLGGNWGTTTESEAIADIELGRHIYIAVSGDCESKVEVVNGETRKYLRTNRDRTPKDNLDWLPACNMT